MNKYIPESELAHDVRTDFQVFDKKPVMLPGWPGYRTQPGKSGLGYLETQAEWAHIQGVLFRKLITGGLQTRNPVYLICLSVYGLISASPLALLFVAEPAGRMAFMSGLALFAPNILIGLLLLINMTISLFKYNPLENITGD